ncbi:hypothetical protein EXIGLDRAFT_758923 [Exidia glandulosa HHB12029]|uniref:AAA-ATPase-like domain-containing protein n=1 Tax=Exidia glandulosa HHB12029 TaxID=1314781 RepID=A0A165QGE6_EXIGL|nr:hypothetical protein EXIGLDRAFT_758923 [Exidia glandulosa HHB12029]
MSAPQNLACGITNHETFYMYHVYSSTNSCMKSNPTLGQFIADLREDHAEQCTCSVTVGDRVWQALYTPLDDSTLGHDTSSYSLCDLDWPLERFVPIIAGKRGMFHLLAEGIPPKETPLAPEPIKVVREYESAVFRIPGAQPKLPDDGDVDYKAACARPGSLVVDKSRFVTLARSNQLPGWVPVIRRPRGFGKSMLLSMFESYVDIDCAYDGPPFPADPSPHHTLATRVGRFLSLGLQGLLLVLHLDFAQLDLADATSEAELRSACQRFLTACATTCYKRYQSAFVDHAAREEITLNDLVELGYGASHTSKFFVGIDNYTDPLLSGDRQLRERVIVEEIFTPLFGAFAGGCVLRGLIVGGDVPGVPWPYCNIELFRECILELSYDAVSFDMLGVTEPELVALGKVLFSAEENVDLLRQIRQIAGVESPLPTAPYWGRTYSTRDVLAAARALRNGTPAPKFVNSVTGKDYVLPTRTMRPEVEAELFDAFSHEKEIWAKESPELYARLQQEVKKKPRKSDPVSDDGSWPDSDRAAAPSFADSPPPSSSDSDESVGSTVPSRTTAR